MHGDITDIKGAAARTGLAVQTLYNFRSQGTGPKSFALRGRVRYYVADIDEWIADAAATEGRA